MLKIPSLDNADTPEFFEEFGFAVFRNIFTAEEVVKMRQQCIDLFNDPVKYKGDWNDKELIRSLRADLFNRYEDFRWIFYKAGVQNALKKILGDKIGYVPESVLHYAGFGGWHKDTTSQESDGEDLHYEPGCTMVECGVYLQDNSEIYGGGLNVVPETQKQSKDLFVEPKGKKSLFQRAIRKITRDRVQAYNTKHCYSIPSKAGDFVFFNKRINHRGTPCRSANVQKESEKYAIFFIGGKEIIYLEKYTQYIKGRYEYMADYTLDPKFAAECKEQGIYLVDPTAI